MIVKLETHKLMPGMYVVDTGLSWLEHPYLYSREGRLPDRRAVDGILAEGYAEAFIDTEKSGLDDAAATRLSGASPFADAFNAPPARTPRSAPGAAGGKPVPMRQEGGVAKRIYEDALQFAKEFIGKAYRDKTVDLERSEGFVNEVIASVVRNRDALTGFCKLRFYDEYTYTHSINVTVLATAFGQFLGLPETELRPLGLAALFHDLGKANMPRDLINKPGRLTEGEFEIIKRHPLESYALIKEKRSLPHKVLPGIVDHHEKYDGRGYPRGLQGDAISLFGRIISLADVYDALTSERVYKKGMPPYKALGVMYGMRGKDFHPALADRFIKCMGVYPVGSVVRMSDGRYGVVYSSNPDAPLFPTVKIIRDADARPIEPVMADLSAQEDPGRPALSIAEAVDPAPLAIDPASVIP